MKKNKGEQKKKRRQLPAKINNKHFENIKKNTSAKNNKGKEGKSEERKKIENKKSYRFFV